MSTERKTVTEISRNRYEPNLRRRRADMLVNAVIHKLSGLIDDDDMREVSHRLTELFLMQGVQIVTDEDRAKIGLPPAGEYGWTAQELSVLEAQRMRALLEPFPVPILNGDGTIKRSVND